MLAGAGATIAALTVRLLHRLMRSLALLLRELTVLVGVELLDESLALLRGETGTGAALSITGATLRTTLGTLRTRPAGALVATLTALTVRLLHRLVRSLALLLGELAVLVGVKLLGEILALLRGETGTGTTLSITGATLRTTLRTTLGTLRTRPAGALVATLTALTVRLLHRLVRSLALLIGELAVLVGVELLDESLALLRGETGTGAAGLLLLTGRGPAGGRGLLLVGHCRQHQRGSQGHDDCLIHIEMKGGIVFLTKEADRGPPSPIRTQSHAFFYTLSVKKPVIRT